MNNELIFSYLDELIPDPKCELNYNKDYELLIAVMLSAQTTDKRVNEVTKVLFDRYPTLYDLSTANLDDITTIIRPLGNYTKKSKNVIEISTELLNRSNGIVLNDRSFLESLPGVGRKTANVILGELFHENVMAVDTHVERVSKRLGYANRKDDVLTVEKKLNKKIPNDRMFRMHHQLLLFGRYYCKAIHPECLNCKLYDICKEKKKSV